MTVELSQEQVSMTSERLGENDAFYGDFPGSTSTSHEYELNLLESLTFLYNLLYDDKSSLTKTDILSILNSLKERENELPFSFNEVWGYMNIQGVWMPPSLRNKFYSERSRVGSQLWFRNKPTSRQDALKVSTSDFFISNSTNTNRTSISDRFIRKRTSSSSRTFSAS